MSRILVIGGKTKFGAALTAAWKDDYVLALGREDLDLDNGWLLKVRDLVEDYWTSIDRVHVVVVNLFDHHSERLGTQERVFKTLWPLFPEAHFVVIGSAIHHYGNTTPEALAKKSLFNVCQHLSKLNYSQKLLLVEPGPMENTAENNGIAKFSSFDDMARSVVKLVDLNLHFLQAQVRHLP